MSNTEQRDGTKRYAQAKAEENGEEAPEEETEKDKDEPDSITFLDTPGHAAFSSMRIRGAQMTDIALIIIAADDGVQEQTIESIKAAKNADVSIIVVVNKIDKRNANVDRIHQQLLQHEVVVETLGGPTPCIPVSALTGEGLDVLEQAILLQAAVLELRAPLDGQGEATVVESKHVKGRGALSTLIVRGGTLRVGDVFVCGNSKGKIRGIVNDQGKAITEAPPSTVVEVSGFEEVQPAGTDLIVCPSEDRARAVLNFRIQKTVEFAAKLKDKPKKSDAAPGEPVLDAEGNPVPPEEGEGDEEATEEGDEAAEDSVEYFNAIIKADVDGSIEAIKAALSVIPSNEVAMKIIKSGVGAVSPADVEMAELSDSVILSFGMKVPSKVGTLADSKKVTVYEASIIYNMVDKIKKFLSTKLKPTELIEQQGLAEILEIFTIDTPEGDQAIAGCRVIEGSIKRNSRARILRGGDSDIVHDATITSLRQFKSTVAESRKGTECGIALGSFEDYQKGDRIQAITVRYIPRSLE
eukprot:TRINITY_DN6034_c0_g1_i1.p1 TRINITY_DN6034_c0_g1~~TRINITY_DN6034_c0_g1_i1.p1  ORF type:complete len:524 (-),score=151.98 TRINITY_DN6034_c0_g1_i1:49-1620(-)